MNALSGKPSVEKVVYGGLVLLVVLSGLVTAHPPLFRGRQSHVVKQQDAEARHHQHLTANVFTRFLNLTPQALREDGKQCKWQGRTCDPYGVPCCQDMLCLNALWGYCLPGLETCLCLPVTGTDNYALGR